MSSSRTHTPAAFDFSNNNVPATQKPSLQQVFHAGGLNVSGLESADFGRLNCSWLCPRGTGGTRTCPKMCSSTFLD